MLSFIIAAFQLSDEESKNIPLNVLCKLAAKDFQHFMTFTFKM